MPAGAILLEGAQGTMLDVDHGTYPYVTSSNTVAGAVSAGAGVGPGSVQTVIGISKAYTTRVGDGPFPTEEHGALGERLRASGDEYGATTGRPRRCGWFDAVLVRQAARSERAQRDRAHQARRADRSRSAPHLHRLPCRWRALRARVPASTRLLEQAVPEYEDLPGWTTPLTAVRKLEELPANARRYVDRLEELTATPFEMISVGAEREETILLG